MISNQNKQILNYGIYQIIGWLFFMILVSVSTFFHFLLNHRLGVIEDWLFEFGWQLIIFSKLISFIFLYSFFKIKFDVGNPMETIFFQGNKKIKNALIKSIFFILVSATVFGSFHVNFNFNFLKTLASYISSTLFFGLDIVFIMLLQKVWKVDEEKNSNLIWIFSGIFVILSHLFYFKDSPYSLLFLIHIFLVLKFTFDKYLSWSNPMLYVLLIVGASVSLIGLDPVWTHHFTIINSSFGNDAIFLYAIIFVNLIYLILNKNNEKIFLGGFKRGTNSN